MWHIFISYLAKMKLALNRISAYLTLSQFTDIAWRCTGEHEAGWNRIGHDHSNWKAAELAPDQPICMDMNNNAGWVWVGGRGTHTYCRLMIP